MKSKKLQKIRELDHDQLFQNYGERQPVCFVRGKGPYLYDQDNRRYVDFLSGIATNCLGYAHPGLSRALHRQVDAVMHTSNLYFNREQAEAARLLSEASFPGKSLFVNSGAEANEAAIKLARRYGLRDDRGRFRIVTFTNSFHGRTFGSMSATAQKKIHDGFGPIVPGFTYLPFNDVEELRKTLRKSRDITAVMLELVQGESGINVASRDFVKELFYWCQKNDILTIIDEVQTGIGRTGQMFAYQHYNVVPDIITMAKALGGGIPVGAIHVKGFLAEYFPKGSHGSTFGGNHMAAAAICAVLTEMQKSEFMTRVNEKSGIIFKTLESMQQKYPFIKEVRGLGLHIGVELTVPAAPVVARALEKGLIINCVSDNVVRIMPPLNIPAQAIRAGMKILGESLSMEAPKK